MTGHSFARHARLRVGIIGGGLAGLAAARTLGELGHAAVVFDKGRGPGGRSSSRRAEPFAFDHGAQYFTAREASFQGLLADWLEQGVVARWDARLVALRADTCVPVQGPTQRFVGTPQMNALAKHLARGLELHSRSLVTSIEGRARSWQVVCQDGVRLGPFDRLVIAVPPAQAAALIGDQSPLAERAKQFVMRPCWAVLLGLAEPHAVEFDGAFCEASSLAWACRDSSKPGRPASEAWALHASSEWTADHLDAQRETVAGQLAAELERLGGVSLPAIVHRDAHLWRFAQPDSKVAVGALQDHERGLVLAGDAYGGGRVEGAYLNGVAAARALV